jgi:hypothetical protein
MSYLPQFKVSPATFPNLFSTLLLEAIMLDYVLFPLIGVLLSLNTINKIFLETKSTWFAGFAGIFAFLCTMWLSGYFLYGLGLFAVYSLLLLITSTPKEERHNVRL